MMRTTVSLDDDLLALTRSLAEQRHISFSEAVNFLIKRGLRPSVNFESRNGFYLFPVSDERSTFGPDDVAEALKREDEDLASSFID